MPRVEADINIFPLTFSESAYFGNGTLKYTPPRAAFKLRVPESHNLAPELSRSFTDHTKEETGYCFEVIHSDAHVLLGIEISNQHKVLIVVPGKTLSLRMPDPLLVVIHPPILD